jgi:protein ImuB
MRRCYVHLPRFPVQRRVLETPSLAGQPLALVENARGHLRVAFASTAAQKAGVRPGMTRTAACALLPDLALFDYQPDREVAALRSLGEALLSLGPQFALQAPDGLVLDAGAAHLQGGEEGLCQAVLEACRAHGYRARVVVASEAFTARALARHGELRTRVVPPAQGAGALGPLPLAALEGPLGAMGGPLRGLGLSSLGEVAALPPGALVARLGADGLAAHRLCRGEDDTPFVAEPLTEAVVERMELDWPAEAMEPLLFALKTALDRLCARLWGRGQAAVGLVLTLHLDPGGEAKVPLRLSRPSAQQRMLLELCRHRISDLTLPRPVSALSVEVTLASLDRGQQLPLGEDGPSGDAALEVVLSRLSTALGEEALFCAALGEGHRPEGAWRKGGFHPPAPARGLFAQAQGGPGAGAPDTEAEEERTDALLERPVRFFERPATLEAEVGEGGELRGARLLGKRRRVEAWAGPERLGGEWWEAAYARDYYRVHFEGLGPVWLFRDDRDGRFYLHGLFD